MMWAILPYTMVQREALRNGEFPLWNRYNTIGEPLWGQAQTFFLDPFHLASLAIPDPSVAMDLRFIVGRIVFAIGSGLTVAVVTGNGLAAVLVALSRRSLVTSPRASITRRISPSSTRRGFCSLTRGSGASPCSAIERAPARCWRSRRGYSWSGSTPKEGLIALIAAHAAGLLGLLVAPGAWKDRLGRVDFALLGGITAVLASAPHWWVFLDTLSRSWTLYDTPSVQFAVWPHTVSYVLGGAAPGALLTGATPLAVMAAALALAYPGWLLRSGVGLGALLAVLGVVSVAYGAVPAELLIKLPLLPNIHHIANSFLAATLAPLLVLAGVGLAGALDEAVDGPALRPIVAVAAATLVCAMVVPGSAFQMTTIVGMATVVGAAAALAVLPTVRRAPTPSGVLALALAAAIRRVCRRPSTGDWGRRRRHASDTATPTRRSRCAIARAGELAGQRGSRAVPGRADGVGAVSRDSGLLGPRSHRRAGCAPPARHRVPERRRRGRADAVGMVDRAAAGDAEAGGPLSRHAERAGPWRHAPTWCLPARTCCRWTGPTSSGWSRGHPPGRARSSRQGVARHRGVAGVAERLQTSNGPFSSVDEQDVSAVAAVAALPTAGTVVPASDYTLTANSTSFRVKTTGPGVAVLSEGFVEHDFQATLNGEPAPYFRVNHALKGVVVPAAGDWTVGFEYRPQHWIASWFVAAFGAFGFLAMALAKPLLS